MKDINNKIGGYSDLPLKALTEAVKRIQENKDYNGGKYSRDNHLQPLSASHMLDAIMRHWIAYVNGEDIDPDTTTSHLAAIIVNSMLMEEQRLSGILIDDRLSKISKQ